MTTEEVAPEDLVSAFVEGFNARDLEAIGELLSVDCELHGIVEDADTPMGVLNELQSRSPWMSLARAELGLEPVAAIWIPDENQRYRLVGYFSVETNDAEITRIELFEDVPEELLSETPDVSWAASEVESTEGDTASGFSHGPLGN